MALVNIAEREEKQVKKLLAQITKDIKRLFNRHGAIEHWKDEQNGVHTISVENGLGGFSDNMRDFVRKSEFGVYVGHGEKPGHYMWDANVYIKDYSWVSFTI